ncbi:MAG: hypothetical protein QOE55_5303, partial [Acidobacteriaceae bacterium]|nr:hypothetical protein [Acidobacteriaceae bacterium]
MRRATSTFPDSNSKFSTIPISTIDKGTWVAALQGSIISCRRETSSFCVGSQNHVEIGSRKSAHTLLRHYNIARLRSEFGADLGRGIARGKKPGSFKTAEYRVLPAYLRIAKLKADDHMNH